MSAEGLKSSESASMQRTAQEAAVIVVADKKLQLNMPKCNFSAIYWLNYNADLNCSIKRKNSWNKLLSLNKQTMRSLSNPSILWANKWPRHWWTLPSIFPYGAFWGECSGPGRFNAVNTEISCFSNGFTVPYFVESNGCTGIEGNRGKWAADPTLLVRMRWRWPQSVNGDGD